MTPAPPGNSDTALLALDALLSELFPEGGTVTPSRLAEAAAPLLGALRDRADGGGPGTPAGPDPHDEVVARLSRRAGRPRASFPAPARLLSLPDIPPVQPDPDTPQVPQLGARYHYRREIGRGGQGRILEARDRDVGRVVALKVLRDPNAAAGVVGRFVAEAQVTGQLEHPNIVPVHDLGYLPVGGVYYTMKRVEGRSLEQVFKALRRGERETAERYTLIRLLTLLQQVCQGLHFAHARGVIHRDLKPANIMLGDYGEVLILDWGLAKVVSGVRDPFDLVSKDVPAVSPGGHLDTRDGFVQGTPPYMAPEQARNERHRVGPWSDVYALGAILYQLLCHELTWPADDPRQAMLMLVERDPVAPHLRAPHLRIPEELSDLAMRCLEREPERRIRSARDLEQAIEDFIEGRRRREQAAERIRAGRTAADRYQSTRLEVDRLEEVRRQLASRITGPEPLQDKAALWELEDRVEETRRRVGEAFLDAQGAFEHALAWDDTNGEARAGLAALYWTRFRDAEVARSREDVVYFEGLVRRYDDGAYRPRLLGDGELLVESTPPGAQVWLYRYREQGRRMRPAEGRLLGRTPVGPLPIAMGAWLLVLRADGGLDTRYPLSIGRGESQRAKVRLMRSGSLRDDLHHVPAGAFLMGGDPFAPGASAHELLRLPDFAISRFPVTVGDYLDFIRDLGRKDAAASHQHAPRRYPGAPPSWPVDRDGLYILPEGEGPGGRLDPMRPASGIDRGSAESYAAWIADRLAIPLRLPTEAEWEKAGRGADGRWFPWGDRFDPTFCKMRQSRPGQSRPEAIGQFAPDRSPYGVRDLAGGVREWCSGWLGDREDLAPVRGGSWQSPEEECRLSRRTGEPPTSLSLDIGFRLAMTV